MTILSVILAGVLTSSVSADVHVKGMLSTGETFDGKLLRDDGRRLSVKGEKRAHTLAAANIVECTIRFADEKLPAGPKGLPLGGHAEFLLSKGHGFLAESTLLCALARSVEQGKDGGVTLLLWDMERVPWKKLLNRSQATAVKAMYAEARGKLPIRLGGARPRTWSPRRYQLPSPSAIRSAIAKRNDWGRKMGRIAANTHRIETAHFVIYSSWSKNDDARLKSIYEKLYVALCRQFDVPATENIWIGKLSVFAFWKKEDFARFCVEVSGISEKMTSQVAGYAGYREWFQFVNLGPVMRKGGSKASARTWFYELLVHESTHAFLMRYIKYEWVSSWLSEGVAELLAATLVPRGSSLGGLKAAHAIVKRGRAAEFLPMLTAESIPVEYEYYGAAQSLVRFLLARSKTKFLQLVSELKNGSGSEDALQKTYGLSHKQMLQLWAKQAR